MTANSQDSLSDNKLIQLCIKDDSRAKKIFYKRYYSYSFSVALRYVVSKELAAEVVNDSFVKLFNSLDDFDTKKSIKSWFRRIIINTAIDQYRKEKRHIENVSADEKPSSFPDNYEDIISKLTVKDILNLLEGLSKDQRIIFNLYEIENYSHKEIAEIMEISAGTSRSYLSRAKAELQKLFTLKFGEHYEPTI